VSATTIRIVGLALSLLYAGAVVRVYVRQPASLPEVAGSLASSVGAYSIDRPRFDAGLHFFRQDQFVEARDAFAQADPGHQDPTVQFYTAYSYLRQGWGRVYADDALYRAGKTTLAQRPTAVAERHHRDRRREPEAAQRRRARCGVRPGPDARVERSEPGAPAARTAMSESLPLPVSRELRRRTGSRAICRPGAKR
jgi:hypothetical protein